MLFQGCGVLHPNLNPGPLGHDVVQCQIASTPTVPRLVVLSPRFPIQGPNEHDQDSLAYQQFFEHGGIKRVYFGSPDDLKADLDMAQGDADSSLVEMAAKAPGVQYWLWRNKRLKGAIKLTTPSGEVVCQGNFKQQVALYGLLKTCAG